MIQLTQLRKRYERKLDSHLAARNSPDYKNGKQLFRRVDQASAAAH